MVTIHSFEEPWESWEVHENGEELVVCLAGRITLHQEVEGEVQRAAGSQLPGARFETHRRVEPERASDWRT